MITLVITFNKNKKMLKSLVDHLFIAMYSCTWDKRGNISPYNVQRSDDNANRWTAC